MRTSTPGTVVTFYSYKGGTGRSMALANAAWLLASAGHTVLVIDWDLEAPGLHRYFAPFLRDRALAETDGLIDLVIDFASEVVTPPDDEAEGGTVDEDWVVAYAERVLRYTIPLDWPFSGGGLLDFLPAGRQSGTYSTRVNSFDWQHFYEELGGGAFLDAVRDRVRTLYDFVLIDSRTGVSDTSGICTVQMPDALVVCFTLNNQGIEGAAGVADSVYQQHRKARGAAGEEDGGGASPFRIFPVPMRVENAEKEKRGLRWDYALRKFAPYPPGLTGEARDRYWREVSVRYDPYYAYEEILAFFGDKQGRPNELLDAAHRLVEYLVGRAVAFELPDEESRRWVLAQFEQTAEAGDVATLRPAELAAYAEKVYASLAPEEQAAARAIFAPLALDIMDSKGLTMMAPWVELASLDDDARKVARRLVAWRLLELNERRGGESVGLTRLDLPDCWGRLAKWVEEDGEFLRWRRRLAASIAEWTEAKSTTSMRMTDDGLEKSEDLGTWEPAEHERGLLLSGTRLETAQEWLARRRDELSPAERRYIEASGRADALAEVEATRVVEMKAAEYAATYRETIAAEYATQAQSRSRRTFWAGGVAAAVVLAVIGVLAFQQREQTQVAATLADSLRTVSQVATLLADAEAHYAAERPDSAFAALARADALSPNNPLVYDRRARLREREGDTAYAVRWHVHTGDLYLAAGDTAAAVAAWRRAMKLPGSDAQRDSLLQRFRVAMSQ